MKTSEQINELAAALMLVQNQVGNLPKTAQGYGYNYTPLDEVTKAIREPLAENGLSYVQMPSTPPVEYYPSVSLTTRLLHISGQWLEDTMIIPVPSVGKANEAQNYGAALTYARRYALTAMFGIAADEDTDGTQKPPAKKVDGHRKQPPPPSKPRSKGNGNSNAWASSSAVHFSGDTEPESLNDNIVDCRVWLEDKFQDGRTNLGVVIDAVEMTSLYDNKPHIVNAIKQFPNWPETYKTTRSQELKGGSALAVFDWLIERKAEAV